MNKKILMYLLMLVFISACESTPTKTNSDLKNLSFVDMEDFDENLSKSMSADLNTIQVKIIGPVSINQIPERLRKWFTVVREKNGRVDLTETKKHRKKNGDHESGMSKVPIILFVSALPSAYKYLKNESVYGNAANYNVKIYYNPDSGKIEKLIFQKKAQ